MINQYPHTITITTQAVATQNAQGNWESGTTSHTDKKGRYEPKSGNGFITAADGERINYDGIVYLPLPQATLVPGSKVVVKKGAEVLCTSSIKRFSAGQLNARIWL